MRIIAGEWRGRKLLAPKGLATRPTADRTRETLFNILSSRFGSFDGLSVADLFAGSGALGLEALSRGAADCLFVEEERAALDAIRANVAALDAGSRVVVQAGSVTQLAPAKRSRDLVLLDPPYDTGAGAVALHRLLRLGWLDRSSLAVVETSRSERVEVRGFVIEDERNVGKARLTFLHPE